MYSSSAVSTTANPPLSQADKRRSSRSASLSSSSITTVKRASSLTSATAPPARPSTAPFQPHNPVEESTGATRLPKSQDSRRRSSIAHSAIESLSGIKGGIGNLNRWSQSTTSSRSSTRDGRRDSFSRRMSVGVTTLLTSPHGSTAPHTSPSRKNPSNRRRSPGTSPQRRTPSRSPGATSSSRPLSSLPPLTTLPTLSRSAFDPATSSPATTGTPPTSSLYTPSTHASSGFDYFSAKPQGILLTPEKRKATSRRDKPSRSPLPSPHVTETNSQATSGDGARALKASESALQASRQVRLHGKSTVQQSQSGPQNRVPLRRDRSISDSSRRTEGGNLSTPPRNTERRERDRKTMLSRALQKANTAVLLDNAQNFEGAIEAYEDACRLLQQVMLRSSEEEDRRKLDSIRVTYTNRIEELQQLEAEFQPVAGKSLPARPMSNESIDSESRSVLLSAINADEEPAIVQTAMMTRIVNDSSIERENQSPLSELQPGPALRESVFASALRDVENTMSPSLTKPFRLELPLERTRSGDGVSRRVLNVDLPMDSNYMPAPLSPRRPISPNPLPDTVLSSEQDSQTSLHPPQQDGDHQRSRGNSNESMSWLNTALDESGGSSCSSSIHSISSSNALRRRHIRANSGATEAEFDAALDAAVEAAYDDGLEPYDADVQLLQPPDVFATASTNVQLAKEQARQGEREDAIRAACVRERERQLREEPLPRVRDSETPEAHDHETEEEERLLDEMTKEYMLDGFDFGLQSKSALPYESDSSSFSGHTWNSSVSSHRTTTTNSLSTVSEATVRSSNSSQMPSKSGTLSLSSSTALPSVSESAALPAQMPPPAGALPKLPGLPTAHASSVRNRRMSGQNLKQLKIETSMSVPNAQRSSLSQPEDAAQAGMLKVEATASVPRSPSATSATSAGGSSLPEAVPKTSGLSQANSHMTAVSSLTSPAETTVTISPATPALTQSLSNESTLAPASPTASRFSAKGPSATGLRKNKSSLSLKNSRTLSVSSPEGSEGSVGTPMSMTFSSFAGQGRKGYAASTLTTPTPTIPTFNTNNLSTGGSFLFDSDIHSPYNPGTPNPMVADAPLPLEPCPEPYLLRPFWLMRCFYQIIAHPRGGYLSTRLFVPKDAWRVRGVKIKAVDEKISNCDLLTAALLKVGSVDTLDADAVLEEMQCLEQVLDQVQVTLTKKLGSEVGVQGISSFFKDASTTSPDGSQGTDSAPAAKSASGKSYLPSWRKLRSKNSNVALNSTYSAAKELPKDALTMSTLPMTSLPNIRIAKREMSNVEFSGPNANYMNALARLCDAVQIIDQIARQVEDPGLKHSSPTHVGLELSTRHASEFFGFYICRFVLTDLTLMLEKFIKRGSEWVLA